MPVDPPKPERLTGRLQPVTDTDPKNRAPLPELIQPGPPPGPRGASGRPEPFAETVKALARNPIPPSPAKPEHPREEPGNAPATQESSNEPSPGGGDEHDYAMMSSEDIIVRLRAKRKSLPPLNLAEFLLRDGEVTQEVVVLDFLRVKLRRHREAEPAALELLIRDLSESKSQSDRRLATVARACSAVVLGVYSINDTVMRSTGLGATGTSQDAGTDYDTAILLQKVKRVDQMTASLRDLLAIEVFLFHERCRGQLTMAALKNT